MARAMQDVPLKEKNTFKQGRSGSGSTLKTGPASKGKKQGGPVKGGGITQKTRGKLR